MFKLLSLRHGDILLLKCQVDLKHEKVQVNQLLAEWFLLTTLIISDSPNLLDPPSPPPPPPGGHVLDHEGSEVKDNASFDHSPRAPNVSERIQDMAFILVPHTHTHTTPFLLLVTRNSKGFPLCQTLSMRDLKIHFFMETSIFWTLLLLLYYLGCQFRAVPMLFGKKIIKKMGNYLTWIDLAYSIFHAAAFERNRLKSKFWERRMQKLCPLIFASQ